LPDEPAAPQPGAAREELQRYKVARKAYILSIQKRFEYVKPYNVMKRAAEKEQNPFAKMLAPIIARFTGKKERG